LAAKRNRQTEVRHERKSRYSDEQIAAALRQAETGTPVAEITRKLGIAEATFYVWKKRFDGLGTPEIRELRQLREENARLKHIVADLTLDRQVLQDVLKKSGSAGATYGDGTAGAQDLAAERATQLRDPYRKPRSAALPIPETRRSGVAPPDQGGRYGPHPLRLQAHQRALAP
jgi:putative transposase